MLEITTKITLHMYLKFFALNYGIYVKTEAFPQLFTLYIWFRGHADIYDKMKLILNNEFHNYDYLWDYLFDAHVQKLNYVMTNLEFPKTLSILTNSLVKVALISVYLVKSVLK